MLKVIQSLVTISMFAAISMSACADVIPKEFQGTWAAGECGNDVEDKIVNDKGISGGEENCEIIKIKAKTKNSIVADFKCGEGQEANTTIILELSKTNGLAVNGKAPLKSCSKAAVQSTASAPIPAPAPSVARAPISIPTHLPPVKKNESAVGQLGIKEFVIGKPRSDYALKITEGNLTCEEYVLGQQKFELCKNRNAGIETTVGGSPAKVVALAFDNGKLSYAHMTIGADPTILAAIIEKFGEKNMQHTGLRYISAGGMPSTNDSLEYSDNSKRTIYGWELSENEIPFISNYNEHGATNVMYWNVGGSELRAVGSAVQMANGTLLKFPDLYLCSNGFTTKLQSAIKQNIANKEKETVQKTAKDL